MMDEIQEFVGGSLKRREWYYKTAIRDEGLEGVECVEPAPTYILRPFVSHIRTAIEPEKTINRK